MHSSSAPSCSPPPPPHSRRTATRTLHRKYASADLRQASSTFTEHQDVIPPQRRVSDVSTASEESDCSANHACSRRSSVADLVKTYETMASAMRPPHLDCAIQFDDLAKNNAKIHQNHDDAIPGAERGPNQTIDQHLDRHSDSDTLVLALASLATPAALESAVMDSHQDDLMLAMNVPLPDDLAPALPPVEPGTLEQFRVQIHVTFNNTLDQLRRLGVRFIWLWILQPFFILLLKELVSTHIIGSSNTTTDAAAAAAAANPYPSSIQQAQLDFASTVVSTQTSNLWCLPSHSWWPNLYNVPSSLHACPEMDIWSERTAFTYQILWPRCDFSLPTQIRESWAHAAEDYLEFLRQAGHLVRTTALHRREDTVAQAVFANVTYAEAKLRKVMTTTTTTDISSAPEISLLEFIAPGRVLGWDEGGAGGGGEGEGEENYFGVMCKAREQMTQAFWALNEGFRTVMWVEKHL